MGKDQYSSSGIKIIIILFVGKVLGFIKQLIVGWTFGANQGTDIFFIAEGFIATVNNAIFAAFAVTLLRSYVIKKKKGDDTATSQLLSNTLFMGTIGAFVILTIMDFLAPAVAKLLAPAYMPSEIQQLSKYIILLSPAIFICSMTSVLGAVLDGERLFIFSKLSGIITSICYIVICITLAGLLHIDALILATVSGYVVYFIFLAIVIKRSTKLRILKPFWSREVLEIVVFALPVMLGNAVTDINAVVAKTIATELETGSVSALYYGQIASYDIVNGIFISGMGSILLTYFTNAVIAKDTEKIIKKGSEMIDISFVLLTLFAVFYIVLSKDISMALFGHGNLSSQGTILIAACMCGYAFGFPLLSFRDVLVKIHYAYGDMKRPMLIAGITVAINIAFSIVLSKYWGVLGISLASSVALIFAIFLLEKSIKKYTNNVILPSIKNIIQLLIATGFTLVTISVIKSSLHFNLYFEIITCCIGGIVVYIVILTMMKNEMIKVMREYIINKLGK